jgi:hypothetical protein
MKFSEDLRPALDIVRQYDPATYARMDASPWHVTTDASDVPLDMLFVAREAHGVTSAAGEAERYAITFINKYSIADAAFLAHVPGDVYIAYVLVHEWAHTGQRGMRESVATEAPAFDAGTAFALRLPAPWRAPLERDSEETREWFGTESDYATR